MSKKESKESKEPVKPVDTNLIIVLLVTSADYHLIVNVDEIEFVSNSFKSLGIEVIIHTAGLEPLKVQFNSKEDLNLAIVSNLIRPYNTLWNGYKTYAM